MRSTVSLSTFTTQLALETPLPLSRWKIEWHWADSQLSIESLGAATLAAVPVSKFKQTTATVVVISAVRKHMHPAAFWVHQRAARLRRALKRAKAAADAAHAKRSDSQQGRKMLVAQL